MLVHMSLTVVFCLYFALSEVALHSYFSATSLLERSFNLPQDVS